MVVVSSIIRALFSTELPATVRITASTPTRPASSASSPPTDQFRGRFGSHRYEGQFSVWSEDGDQEVADLQEQGGFLLLRRCIPDHGDINVRHLTHPFRSL